MYIFGSRPTKYIYSALKGLKYRTMKLALYQPDIPQNTGTILRLAACLDVEVHVIGPTGFDMTDRSLRRAGLDYLDHVTISRHISFNAFLDRIKEDSCRLILLTTHAEDNYTTFQFQDNDILMLGRESSGVPQDVHDIVDARLAIPLRQEMRSLNIAVAAGMVLGEALRQTNGFPSA